MTHSVPAGYRLGLIRIDKFAHPFPCLGRGCSLCVWSEPVSRLARSLLCNLHTPVKTPAARCTCGLCAGFDPALCRLCLVASMVPAPLFHSDDLRRWRSCERRFWLARHRLRRGEPRQCPSPPRRRTWRCAPRSRTPTPSPRRRQPSQWLQAMRHTLDCLDSDTPRCPKAGRSSAAASPAKTARRCAST